MLYSSHVVDAFRFTRIIMQLSPETESQIKQTQSSEGQIKRRKTQFSVKSKTYKKLTQKLPYVPWILNPLLKLDSPSRDEVRQF